MFYYVCRSFGIALWELITFGAMPYGELNNEQVIRQVFCDGSVRLSQPEVPVSNIDKLLVYFSAQRDCKLFHLCYCCLLLMKNLGHQTLVQLAAFPF